MEEKSATLVSVKGNAWIVGLNGQVRAARTGDKLQPGETIVTGRNGQVELAQPDGQTVELPASQAAKLDAQMSETQRPQAAEAALGAGTVERIEQVIARGGSLDEVEPPAAGAGAGGGQDGGHGFVRLLRIVELIDPLAFEFGTERPELKPEWPGYPGDLLPPQNGLPELDVLFSPTLGMPAGTVYESALSNGSDAAATTETTQGSFAIDSPDGIGSLVINGVDVTNGGTVVGEHGTLVVTVVDGTYNWTYTLDGAIKHPGSGADGLSDNFTVVVTDRDGDRASGNLPITIVDDLPTNGLQASDAPLPQLVVDETTLDADARIDFSGTFTSTLTPGADGLGSFSSVYGVSVSSPGADSGLIDVATGQPVLLDVVGGVVEGRTASGELVFTLSVDASGTVTLDQIRALGHPDGSNPDDVLTLADAGLIVLTRTDTATDGDGDTISSSASLNIGQTLVFRDDGPTVGALSGSAGSATLDETGGFDAATIAGSALFATPNFGADGAGSVSYALTDAAGNPLDGVGTGLYLAGGTEEIVLRATANGYEGVAGTTVAFTATIDPATGDVTITQLAALEHTTDGATVADHDDALTLDGLLHVTQTATDRDGDTARATSGAALDITFRDDGPTVGAISGSAGSATLDETGGFDAATIAGSALFATPNFGADGAGSVAYTLTDAAGNPLDGVGTGLYLAGGTEEIVLRATANGYEGVAGTTVAFTATIDPTTGDVTITQLAALEHTTDGASAAAHDDALTLDGLLHVTQTATDRDGDTARATSGAALDITFRDEGPAVGLQGDGAPLPQLVVDESALDVNASVDFGARFTSTLTPGADGLGSFSSVYGLSVSSPGADSGLIDVATGQPVLLDVVGGVVEGRTASGELVFTLSVDASGSVTLDQIRALGHPDGSNPDDALTLADAGLIVLTRTDAATDGDGDTSSASASLNIGQTLVFRDDGPTAQGDGPHTVTEDGATQSVSGQVLDNDSYGVDGASASQTFAWGDNTAVMAALSNYGTLTLGSDGHYSFVLNNGSAAVQALTASDLLQFNLAYTLRDGDGDTASAALTLQIQGTNGIAGVTVSGSGADSIVYEAGLTSANDASEMASGSFQISATDGIGALNVGGLALTLAQLKDLAGVAAVDKTVDTGEGLLVITGYTSTDGDKTATVTYSYTLKEAQTHSGGVNLTDSVPVTVQGADGGSGSADLKIGIVDDVPVPNDDADNVTIASAGGLLGRTTTGNVISGDGTTSSSTGRDGAGADGSLLLTASGATVIDKPTVIVGTHGELTLSPSGFYSYRVTNPAATDGDSDTFQYTVTDADGSSATANLTIFLGKDNLIPEVAGSTATVSEKGLDVPGKLGSEADTDVETTSGSFTIRDNGQGFELLVGGTPVYLSGGLPATIAGVLGTLTLTGYTKAGSGTDTAYTVNYTYTLTTNASNNLAAAQDTFAVKVVDGTGDASNVGNITINVTDDGPTARADVDSAYADYSQTAIGNVITGDGTQGGLGGAGADTHGADGVKLVAYGNTHNASTVALVPGSTANGASLQGKWGTLTMNADGSYVYRINTNHLGAATGDKDVFTYTLRDADGTTSTTTLTVEVGESIIKPTITVSEHTVQEAGLDKTGYGATEYSGSNPDSTDEYATGSFTIDYGAANAISLRSINGYNLLNNGVGQVFESAHGTLTITGVNFSGVTHTYSYRYELKEAVDHSGGPVSDQFIVRVRDYSGDMAEEVIRINIADDTPIAHDDTETTIGLVNLQSVGNVVTGQGTANPAAGKDFNGADSPTGSIAVTHVNGTPVASGGSTVVAGAYGTLTMYANGSYSYVLNQTLSSTVYGESPVPDKFTYTLIDGDGSSSTATLSVDITPLKFGPGVDGAIYLNPIAVDEAGLDGSATQPAGSLPGTGYETVTSNFILGGFGGPPSLSINGTAVDLANLGAGVKVATTYGSMTITGYNPASGVVSYTYTLETSADHSGGSAVDRVAISASGPNGTANATLPVSIWDDAPFAGNDTDSVKESDVNNPATGNVLTGVDAAGGDANATDGVADASGADGALALTHVNGTAIPVGGTATIAGNFGTLTIGSDGAYRYVPNVGNIGSNRDVFTYTLADGDGSSSTATLTVDVLQNLAPPIVTVNEKTLAFYEADTPQGSNPAGTSDYQSGLTVTINTQGAPLNQIYNPFTETWTSVSALSGATPANPVTLITNEWTLSYTGYSQVGNTVTLTYDITAKWKWVNDNGAVLSNSGHWVATNVNGVTSAETSSSKQVHNIYDDAPVAAGDTVNAVEGAGTVATGNLLGNDFGGADGKGKDLALAGAGTGPAAGSASGGVGVVLQGAYGTLVVSTDGSYVYTMTAPSVPAGATDLFHYTLRDSDGSRSTATITVNIAQDTRLPIVTATTPAPVHESGLSTSDVMAGDNVGSSPGGAPVSTSGSFSINGQGETFTLQIGGQPVPLTTASVGASFTGDHGVLTITGVATAAGVTTVSYRYALGDNRPGAGGDAFELSVTDATGDKTVQNLNIDIVDDAPVARADTDSGLNAVGTLIGGNVITGEGATSGAAGADSLGADHAAVAGVLAGLGVPGASTGGVHTVTGSYGELTLNANGSYSYVVTAGGASSGATDTFTYLLQDQDGSTSTATLTITLGALVVGGSGADSLAGGAGPDTLIGGAGNDNLAGGLGADVFVWQLGHQGTAGSPARDVISDFNPAEGDALNLRDLLQGENTGNLGSYLNFTDEGGNAVLHVSHTGNGAVTQDIVFQGLTVAGLQVTFGASDAADLVNKMKASGQIVTD